MANYQRFTAATIAQVLARAEEVLTARLPLSKTAETHHSVTLSGGDGTVTFICHRHGLETEVVASTDQLRTSRLDNDVQFLLTLLPYQPDDVMATRAERP